MAARVPQIALLGVTLFSAAAGATDSKVCAQCHADIYRRYSTTPMARTSGAVDNQTSPILKQSEFTDLATGVRFRLARKGDSTLVHFSQGDAEGERRLDYFIGAGVVGRSYASMMDGFLFQAPVAYYASTGQWDLSPGFEGSDSMNLTRPVEPACLNCHATGLRAVAGTMNGYQGSAFAAEGVSCERCHGAGETHVARMKSGDRKQGLGIVNPAKLPPAERDSICAQCHLEGVIRISKPGVEARYAPGKPLFDSTSAFLWSGGARRLAANSHFEQLVRSACWRSSGGKLWCGSCHDPHPAVAEGARAVSYRRRCLTCHTVSAPDCSATAQKRQAVKDDCVACHMPSKPIGTVQHAALVDHTISRVPGAPEPAVSDDAPLIPFPGSTAGDRELGLAYASVALSHNNRVWGMRAFALLKEVAAAHPGDAAVMVQLAQLYDRMGQEQQACEFFARVVRDGASGPGALVNQGACQAKSGDIDGAMTSWARALQWNPALEAARLNLAVAQRQSGNTEAARTNLETALKYDPFSQRAHELLRSMPGR
jgi:predicted CXXCH cytochrome family protein